MVRLRFVLYVLLAGCLCGIVSGASDTLEDHLVWESLPDIPAKAGQAVQPGLAGAFVGVHNDVMMVAGGANFPEGRPWEGGKKVFYSDVYVLQHGEDGKYTWVVNASNQLPKAAAYGVSVSVPEGVVCIGGCDGQQCLSDVLLMKWDDKGKQVVVEALPSLPRGLAFMTGAKVGDSIYVAGGQEVMKDAKATGNFWRLDWSKRDDAASFGWEELDSWPGEGRVLAVSAGQSDGQHACFYLFSGRNIRPGETTELLTDGYSYDPQGGQWKALGDVGRCIMGATAVAYGDYHILVIGGASGELFLKLEQPGNHTELLNTHPGFNASVQLYHTLTDTWAQTTPLPTDKPPVTTTAVKWGDQIVVPSGEIQPGIRTAAVWCGQMQKATRSFGLWNWVMLVIYLGALVVMGFYFSKREKTTGDFFLAGRRIPWWAAGLSIFGTQLSAITFMAIPATSFRLNWVMFINNMMIVVLTPFVVYMILPFFRRIEVTTAYEYLEKRFSLPVRLYGSVSFVLMQLGRMGIVVLLPAIALSAVTGINEYTCIIVMGVLCTVYTVMGGIEAVIWTDVLQVIVLIGGALVSFFVIVSHVDGGLGGVVQIGMEADKFRMFLWEGDMTTMVVWVVVVGGFFTNLIPYTSDQAVVQRYLTTKDEQAARKAIWTSGLMTIPGSVIFFAIGTALYAFYKTHPDHLDPSLSNDAIFPLFIHQMLPGGVAGLVIAGVFAAAMSSLDSSMNSVATALTTDFYRRLKPGVSDHQSLVWARILTVILGVLGTGTALVMAYYGERIQSLWYLFSKLMGLLGGGLCGVFLLAIFTRRGNGAGALVGAIAGAAVQIYVTFYTDMNFLLYAVVGTGVCVIVGYVVSLMIPSRDKDLASLTIYTLTNK